MNLVQRIYRRFVRPMFHEGRRSGVWKHADLRRFAQAVAAVSGDFAEIGVNRGAVFAIATLAHQQKRMAHAFDSFEGISPPGKKDGTLYPAGPLTWAGRRDSHAMDGYGIPREWYQVHAGFIPHCFDGVDVRFAFAILDVDHYDPTRDALAWLWPRMNQGGILALDDFIPGQEVYATVAIQEFARSRTSTSLTTSTIS